MVLKKVTAIFDELRLNVVEKALIRHGVTGFTLQKVKGRGHSFDSLNEGHLGTHMQIEVYAQAEQAPLVAKVIIDAAHVNADSEGMVSVLPVDALYWIHEKRNAREDDFRFHAVPRE